MTEVESHFHLQSGSRWREKQAKNTVCLRQHDFLLALKIIAGLSILAVGILGGIIPLLARGCGRASGSFPLAMPWQEEYFSASASLICCPKPGNARRIYRYPLAPLLAAAGIAILLWIDRVYFESMGPADGEESGERRRPLYPMILLAALSIHSVITGIALGLEPEVAASLLVMTGIWRTRVRLPSR